MNDQTGVQYINNMITSVFKSSSIGLDDTNVNQEKKCNNLLKKYNKCIQTININENINKCRDIILLYKECLLVQYK